MRKFVLPVIGVVVMAVSLEALLAQRAGGGNRKSPGPRTGAAASRPAEGAGFFLIPPFVAERMNLTDAQRKQIDDLTSETKAKLFQILTPEQQKMLQDMRPPRPGMGPGGPDGPGGPGGPGGPDDGGPMGPDAPPPGE